MLLLGVATRGMVILLPFILLLCGEHDLDWRMFSAEMAVLRLCLRPARTKKKEFFLFPLIYLNYQHFYGIYGFGKDINKRIAS
jgi:hypothetical protein